MKDYEINEKTLAIIPNSKGSIVYEEDAEYLVDQNSFSIMEQSCEYFGSTLQGRQKGSTALTGITHKVPIIIEESKDIIFFPTASPRSKDCAWISLNNLDNYEKSNGKIKLKFNNNKEILMDMSYGVFDNQVLRATRLESTLRKRKK